VITDAHNHLHWLAEPKLAPYGVDRCSTCGTSPDDWSPVVELSRRITGVSIAIGLHPWYVDDEMEQSLLKLRSYLELNPEAAIGEIGLDRTNHAPAIERQKIALKFQLRYAAELGRPVVLHCVGAYGMLFDQLADGMLTAPAILHGFAGSREMIPRFTGLPFPVYFSVSKPDLLPYIPPDLLLIESDASPDNGRTPAYVVEFHREYGIDPEQTAANYLRVFPDPRSSRSQLEPSPGP
jgi:TatD DNase family protein